MEKQVKVYEIGNCSVAIKNEEKEKEKIFNMAVELLLRRMFFVIFL